MGSSFCDGKICLSSTSVLVFYLIFLSKCTRGILWCIGTWWVDVSVIKPGNEQNIVSTAVKDGHLHRSPEKTGWGRGVVCTDSCKFALRCLMRELAWIIPTKMLLREARRAHYSVWVLTYYCTFSSLLNLSWGREEGGKSQTYQTLRLGRSHVKNWFFKRKKSIWI